MTLRIKGWAKFQHFKDRKPPWIKLYREILDDPDWHELDPVAAKVLVMLWLIASENEGALPDTKKLVFRLRITEQQLNKALDNLSHWVERDDISAISDRYQSDAPETETETETETEKSKAASPLASASQITEIEKARAKNGTRLATDWDLPEEWGRWAESERSLKPKQVIAIADRFKDYWLAKPGKEGVKLDWQATWRNWVRSTDVGRLQA